MTSDKIIKAETGWKTLVAHTTIGTYRSGWAGAWDAIKAAWRKEPVLVAPNDVTISVTYKLTEGMGISDFELRNGDSVLINKSCEE